MCVLVFEKFIFLVDKLYFLYFTNIEDNQENDSSGQYISPNLDCFADHRLCKNEFRWRRLMVLKRLITLSLY